MREGAQESKVEEVERQKGEEVGEKVYHLGKS
jgi:hypothetical protein